MGFLDEAKEREELEEDYQQLPLHNYGFLVWSKEKWSNDLSEEQLQVKFSKRYCQSLPTQHINFVFVNDVSNQAILK